MIVDSECWMNIRRFRALHQAGATYAEIGRECGCDPRTVRKYLAEDASSVPPAASSRPGSQPRLIEPLVELVESWLRTDLGLMASVIHERLVTDYGFTGHYQRVKMFAAEARPRIAAELVEQDGVQAAFRIAEIPLSELSADVTGVEGQDQRSASGRGLLLTKLAGVEIAVLSAVRAEKYSSQAGANAL
jgi:hypothetical protein